MMISVAPAVASAVQGFERLLAAICEGAASAPVLAIEASRLARNGRDWHTLMGVDQCGELIAACAPQRH